MLFFVVAALRNTISRYLTYQLELQVLASLTYDMHNIFTVRKILLFSALNHLFTLVVCIASVKKTHDDIRYNFTVSGLCSSTAPALYS